MCFRIVHTGRRSDERLSVYVDNVLTFVQTSLLRLNAEQTSFISSFVRRGLGGFLVRNISSFSTSLTKDPGTRRCVEIDRWEGPLGEGKEGRGHRGNLHQRVSHYLYTASLLHTVDMIDIDQWVPLDSRSDSLIPSRVEDGRAQVVHACRIGIRLGLSPEDGTVEDDVGDVIQDVSLDFDEIWFAKDDDFDGFGWVTGRVLDILDLRDDPNEVHISHCLAHER